MTEPLTRRDRRAEPRRRVTVIGVIGELLITVGVVALLYVSWQMWIGDWIIGSQKQAEAAQLTQSWADDYESSSPVSPTSAPTGESADPVGPVLDQPNHGDLVGVIQVPRFGEGWQFEIRGGVTRRDILDEGYVGHYPDTAMPGDVGNTVYAAHRWTSGEPFDPVDKLVAGDAIVIATPAGWYTYRFRNLEYVQATQVEVLLPVPQKVGVAADGRYLTLTSCSPKLNMLERIIAYALFEDFTPRSNGPPDSLTSGTAT